MDVVVIGLLVALWAAILLPGLVRARQEASPAASVSRFHRRMDLLEQTNGVPAADGPTPPDGASPHDRRRVGRAPSPSARHAAASSRRGNAARSPGGLTVVERRRVVLASLLAALGFAVVVAAWLGGATWGGVVAVAVGLVGYCFQLRRVVVRERRTRRQAVAREGSPAGAPGRPSARTHWGPTGVANGVGGTRAAAVGASPASPLAARPMTTGATPRR